MISKGGLTVPTNQFLLDVDKMDQAFNTFHGVASFDQGERIIDRFTDVLVAHFAGKKSINDSIVNPLEYYSCNITGTLNLLDIAERIGDVTDSRTKLAALAFENCVTESNGHPLGSWKDFKYFLNYFIFSK